MPPNNNYNMVMPGNPTIKNRDSTNRAFVKRGTLGTSWRFAVKILHVCHVEVARHEHAPVGLSRHPPLSNILILLFTQRFPSQELV